MNSAEQDVFELGLERKSARDKLEQLLGADVIDRLHRRSDAYGFYAVISCWAVIAAAMVPAYFALQSFAWWSIPVLLACVFIIGGRILGLAILTHEGVHRSLFATPSFNDGMTHFLCGAPVFLDLYKYRRHHAQHHVYTGTEKDVDLCLIQGFPTSRLSMARKLLRDLSGQTGIKTLIGFALMNAGVIKWNVAGTVKKLPREGKSVSTYIIDFVRESWRTLLFHSLVLSILWLNQLSELFVVWWIAYVFAYPFCLRVRAIAEHAMTESTPDMLRNTRTTKANFIARLLFAPYRVNYHIEHHALVAVPYWQLPELHKLLREKQVVPEPPTYWQVMKMATVGS